MSKAKRVFVSSEGRIVDQSAWGPLLHAYGEVWGDTLREVYVRLVVHGKRRQELRSELIGRGWKEDEADSVLDAAKAAQEAAVESTKLSLDSAERALEKVEQKLAWAMRGDSPRRRHQRHGLAKRRDGLQARVANLRRRLEQNEVRVCFGGRKLALGGNHPEVSGYAGHKEWRAAWERARSSVVYVKGDSEATRGNACAKISFLGDGSALLRLRIPDLATRAGVRLRDLAGGMEWVEIPLQGFAYGREAIEAALVPAETAAEARRRLEADRARWPGVEPWRDEARALAAALQGLTGDAPRWAKGLPAPPPTTPYKVKRASRPLSVRIVWRARKNAWYVTASTEPMGTSEVMAPGQRLRRSSARVLGIDLNPDHVAWCVVDAEGNPLRFGRVDLDLTGSATQNRDAIGRACAEIAKIAEGHGAPIAHEVLDFARSRASLRYGCSRRVAHLLSSFAYGTFFATLASRCRRSAIARIPVDPAWTSVLGQANYAGVYGVSVDQGAACVIARRALGLRTRVRPCVARAVSQERVAGHMPPCRVGLRLVARALPKRSSTWEPSGLCLRRHSAPAMGPPGVTFAAGGAPPSSQPAPSSGSKDPLCSSVEAVPCDGAVAVATVVSPRTDTGEAHLAENGQGGK